ncbi:hypothetical protein B0H17DRAFT_1334671 [Mycena rosella]|uniref:Uncharacterized protein n=1 Tax=Mycena rosella TaxID=1033263 RepID=A0AAD7D2U4_MYCRO|nr:hypothetical protein B0H17DRAFT_1334671 [Mycena rosella]
MRTGDFDIYRNDGRPQSERFTVSLGLTLSGSPNRPAPPPPPSEMEARCYYTGLPSRPILVSRSDSNSSPWEAPIGFPNEGTIAGGQPPC